MTEVADSGIPLPQRLRAAAEKGASYVEIWWIAGGSQVSCLFCQWRGGIAKFAKGAAAMWWIQVSRRLNLVCRLNWAIQP